MNEEQPIIKIVIADDHEVFRDGLKLMLSKEKAFSIVAEAENGLELIRLSDETEPDIILTDIKMPKMDGIEATRRIHDQNPSIGVIALSMFNEESLVVDMLEAGALGYLLKSSDKAEIIDAVNTVYHHHPYYCKSTSARLAITITESRFNPYNSGVHSSLFSSKEIEVIRLICEEYSTKEIGDKIFQSMRTVEGYRAKILDKMNARNTAGIVIYAIKHGIYEVKK
ncbi:response regulator transcription factor [Sediminibacterium roseum]|uniref:Response regulator transcription factor n=1 Tax=Sediminibacterium roseum TaxID=1978412 RepID=A0ABX0A3A8_9BACT|nr:response regulator transcription factor [Sediminibacterium roseum]NCI51636.1 response regulator transcription factor [Sediminibacterium roseum]